MTKTIDSTPKQDGFRMPGEFEPHAGTWMIWPERPDNWRNGAKPAQKAFAEVAKAISQFEPLTMCVSVAQFNNARNHLPSNVRVVEMSNNDSWMRDCGPTFVTNGNEVRAIDWDFNAWGGLLGGLYFPWDLDDLVARKVADLECVDRYKAPMVLEGGSIHCDGEGTLLTTEECLLNENRNPDMTKEEIETQLKAYLNLEKIIWLKRGIYNDETNGHVDNICCFVKPGVVLLAWTDDTEDPQYEISHENYEILSKSEDAKGRKFEIHKLLLPAPVLINQEESEGVDPIEGTLPRNAGDRLAASYVNFYLCNGGLVMPAFGDPNDLVAAKQLAELYPGRKIVSVPAREILLGGGNIHCITQQQPAV
ncbi:MAG: agmatine deiminase [Anaerolineaceae bacterium]|nr:agmatine deiminase [Anaerolineaceae bacterium]